MGGGVSHNQQHHQRDENSLSFSMSAIIAKKLPLTLSDFPLLSYEEVNTYLPLCIASWNHVVQTPVNGMLLGDLFQIYVFDAVRNFSQSGGNDKSHELLQVLLESKSRRLINPVTYVMRYCIKTKRSSQTLFDKKLMALGREHSRIGVNEDLLMVFCEILLTSFAACLHDNPMSHSYMYAWLANFKYIITQMTNVRFSFLRSISDTLKSKEEVGCSESLTTSSSISEQESGCIYDGLANGNTGISLCSIESALALGKVYLSYDGLDHKCHPIPEVNVVSGKDLSVIFESASNRYDELVSRKSTLAHIKAVLSPIATSRDSAKDTCRHNEETLTNASSGESMYLGDEDIYLTNGIAN